MTLWVNRGSVIVGMAISSCPVKKPDILAVASDGSAGGRMRAMNSGSAPRVSGLVLPTASAGCSSAFAFDLLDGVRAIGETWGDGSGDASIPSARLRVTVWTLGGRSLLTANPKGAHMAIKVGDTIPSMKLMVGSADGPKEVSTDELFKGKKVVLFAVPGAFTPTCSAKHLPGFVQNADAILAKGADSIVCMAVNDPFVMAAWGKDQGVEGKITLLADGSGALTKAMGLELDLVARGLGVRSQRFALVADDGKVTYLAVEPPGGFDVSRAESVMAHL
jgi:peroxiredoxin